MSANILIVEDDPVSGAMLEMMVKNLGHRPLGVVADAESALLSIKKEKPDLVFMDIGLATHMDGIDTAELLSGYYHLPVVFVTMHADKAKVSMAQNIGAGYIVKPFTEGDIRELIDRVSGDLGYNQAAGNEAKPKIQIKLDDKLLFVKYEDIYLFSAQGHRITVYTKDHTYEIRDSLCAILNRDSSGLFAAVHKSFLVNLSKIESLTKQSANEYQILVKDIGVSVPVGRGKIGEIKKRMA